MRKESPDAGFTLTEWAIVLLIVLTLLGIILPVLGREKQKSQNAVAMEYLKQIMEASFAWLRDSRPVTSPEGPDFLAGPGTVPQGLGRSGDLAGALGKGLPEGMVSRPGGTWRGPYLLELPTDPWGNAFLLLGLAENDPHTWVLTPGPDGKVETKPEDDLLQGDDLGMRLR